MAGDALGQVTPPLLAPLANSAEAITGTCITGATVQVTIKTDTGSTIRLDEVKCANGEFSVDSRAVPLRRKYQVTAVQTSGGTSSPGFMREVADGPFGPPFDDEREDFEASAYLGLAIDTFAADDIKRYLNPEANGELHERDVFGFDFAYRLAGNARSGVQLWVYGETVHGVRSQDIDCEKSKTLPSCQNTIAGFAGAIPENALFMLRNARTLEAFIGVRAEFHRLNLPGRHPAVAYVELQPGFLNVAGGDGDAKDMHHVAIGARAVGGPRQGSFLEVGYGRTDLFIENPRRRIKIDGLLQQQIAGGFGFFAELFADVDGKSGADSVQSYFGLSFDLDKVVGTIASAVH